MARWWVSSPLWQRWKLQDIQAALNVAVTIVSTVGIWVFGRYCWQRSAKQIARNRYVLLPSLLSLATPGEAWDILHLLRHRILAVRHTRILAQCVVIISLSVTTILAGLIARFATQPGTIIVPTNTTGYLAKADWNNLQGTVERWNDTLNSLEEAEFPRDQLLDFLPDPTKKWVYNPSEWNSTWHAKCNSTDLTDISLVASGNHTLGSYFFGEVPDAKKAYPPRFLTNDFRVIGNFLSFSNSPGVNKDVLIFAMISSDPDMIPEKILNRSMSFSLAAFHMHNSPAAPVGTEVNFGKGPIESSFYTRIDCDLTRTPKDPDNDHFLAYPWTNFTDSVVLAYGDYYQADFTSQSFRNQTVHVPSATELFRFFQTYMITKDTQDLLTVSRVISIHIPTVRISVVFLSIFGFLTFLLIAGIMDYIIFMYRYKEYYRHTPDTKLDWILQSVKESAGNTPTMDLETRRTSIGSLLSNVPKAEMRLEFESATFGSGDPGSNVPDERRVRRGSSKSYSDFVGLSRLQTSSIPEEDDHNGLLANKNNGTSVLHSYEVASPLSFGSPQFQDPPSYGSGMRTSPRVVETGYGDGQNQRHSPHEDYFRDLGLSPLEGRRNTRYQRLSSGRDCDLGGA